MSNDNSTTQSNSNVNDFYPSLEKPILYVMYKDGKMNACDLENAEQVFLKKEAFSIKDGATLNEVDTLTRMEAFKQSIEFKGDLKLANKDEYGYTAYKEAYEQVDYRQAIPSGI